MMKTFVLIENATGSKLEQRREADDWSAPAHKFGPAHATQWVPVVDEPAPEHDAATHHVTGAVTEELRDGAWHRTPVIAERPVPEQVPLWALREVCALTTRPGQGVTLKAEIDAVIAQLPEPNRTVAAGRWEKKETIRRHDELTGALIALLGLGGTEVDACFRAAQALAQS